MQHFQSILIVIGLIAIGGVLIHGYLIGRKEKESVTERGNDVDIFAEKPSSEETVEQVDDVISEVRIISNNDQHSEPDNIDFSLALNDDKVDPVEFVDEEQPISSTPDVEDVEDIDVATVISAPSSEEKLEQETLEQPVEDIVPESDDVVIEEESLNADQPQDLFIFNVAAREGKLLGGHELLQFFLTSGFRHGEMAIFHRHEHSDGTGPVLFSIANMMAPGVFDTDNMEQFKSEGVSFFLTAPNKDINIKTSFDLMLRAVEQMAEEFDCDVLNAQREKMTTDQFIEYNNRLVHYM
ncbi:cell division protein ZipA [Psychromonas marina]|uniref:Cell division protein ZipA n=1 Tax=Psychromonas marina TaxID=88364 RepID=A0ABQ6DZ60_9GAMM|nr:cell division protein ZipA [Psychromonas marina]GLS90278.1 cell division protein ZipA [Psychromonas marina]